MNGQTGASGGSSTGQMYRRNLRTGQLQLVTPPLTASQCASAGASQPSVDVSGMRVAFQSDLPITDGDTNNTTDVFVAIGSTATPVRVSETMSGGQVVQANAPATSPVISGDGTTIAFVSAATNLDTTTLTTNTSPDVHVAVLLGNQRASLNRLDASESGQTASDPNQITSAAPALDYSGTKLMYESTGGNAAGGTGEVAVSPGTLRVFQQATPGMADKLFFSGFE